MKRSHIAIFGVAVVILTAVFFLFFFKPKLGAMGEAKKRTQAASQKAQQAQTELNRRRDLQRKAPEIKAKAATLDRALPNEPQLAGFILELQESATASGVDWISVAPAQPAAAAAGAPQAPAPGAVPGTQDISASAVIKGGYFQVQDFLVRLEKLSRAVKVGSVVLAPDELPKLTANIQMKIFMTAVQPTLAPTPSASPAP